MEKFYVLISGSGTTSRANLEALIEDYFYAKNKECILVIAYSKVPSHGQVFAAQYARDKGKDIIVFAPDDGAIKSFPSASVNFVDKSTIDSAISFISGEGSVALLLWDDADTDAHTALAGSLKAGIRAYNLTEGLVSLGEASPIKIEDKHVEAAPEPKHAQAPEGLSEELKAYIKAEVKSAVASALQDAR